MMKRSLLWFFGVLVACSFAMTALAACGDEDDDDLTNGVGEASIVALLPSAIAPYANLEVTYYNLQGQAKTFTVKAGETSDDLTAYSKTALRTLELLSGFTIDEGKSIVRTVKFSAPADTKVTCKYKVVLNGTKVTTFPSKAFSPFAVATGKRSNGEALLIQGTTTISQMSISSAEAFAKWLDRIKDKEHETYIVVN